MLWELGHSVLGALLQVYGGPRVQTWFASLIQPAEPPVLFAALQEAIQFAERALQQQQQQQQQQARPILLAQVEILNTEELCSICMEPYVIQKGVRTICSHIFHETCIHTWMQRSLQCPLCRGSL